MASERISTSDSAWSHHDYTYVEYDSGLRAIDGIEDIIRYLSSTLGWEIDVDDFEDIEDVSYDFEASDIGLKEEAFAKVSSLRQLQPLIDGQRWGVFCVEFESKRLEVTALRKILSGLVPKRRNAAEHAVWEQEDLLFICFWGQGRDRTVGIAHFEDKGKGLPQIKIISCAPASEDFTQLRVFGERLSKLHWPSDPADLDEWGRAWSAAFETGYRQTIRDSSTLTVQLAKEARGIRNRVLDVMSVETRNGYVHLLYDKFRNTLIHDMTEEQFADMYAQTVVYGLFSARCMDSTRDDFSADEAIECIPSTNPFLKSLMRECLGSAGSSALSFDELEIGNVTDLLVHADTESIISDFNRQTGGGREDPVIHFYEEFLTAYDKTQKVERGVYYTPQPVVNFIVRAVDHILKEQFGLADGLASEETKTIKVKRQSRRKIGGAYRMVDDTAEVPAVQVLDPATGTGTFIRQTILQIYKNFREAHAGLDAVAMCEAWNEYVPKQLLPRLNAFELMMAPYAVAHMKLAMVLKDTGYRFESDNRLSVFLTNSLEKPGKSDTQMTLFDDPIALESVLANGIKKNEGINVVLGNPPYSGESANKGAWISSLVADYKVEPGGHEKLRERNPKWLNNDYVKFIRLGQEYIQRSGTGILAFICPHGFISDTTFRGMRWQLLQAFSEIYVLDLHGDSRAQETCPDGSKDENVFDIQQGVCITLMIKRANTSERKTKIYHANLYGLREAKYDYLNCTQFGDVNWESAFPQDPFFLFTPNKTEFGNNGLFDVSSLFRESVMGFQTHRDNFAIAFEKNVIQERLADLISTEHDDEALLKKYDIRNNRDWNIHDARKRARGLSLTDISEKTTLCQYRLFDLRYCFLDDVFMDYPRMSVFKHASNRDNYVLGIGRQGRAVGDIEWCLATISRYPMDANIFRRGGVTAAPLYLYRDDLYGGREPNLNEEIIQRLQASTGLSFTREASGKDSDFSPIDVFDYVYAILYSHRYREDYADELKIHYPQIPLPSGRNFFKDMADLGAKLRLLHTMEYDVDVSRYSFIGDSHGEVKKLAYKDGLICINNRDYFTSTDGIPIEAWDYTIGGNQPLQKWLKDRKGRTLSPEEIDHYMRMIETIQMTIEISGQIDQIY